jgi:hypothetical protein
MSRPLIITDCDEVLLHMVVPFRDWLDEVHDVHFTLQGQDFVNSLRRKACGTVLERDLVWEYLIAFFDTEMHRQQPIDGALPTLARLSEIADIVVLTNITERAHQNRIDQLHALGVSYPVYWNQGGKGRPVAAMIERYRPSVALFVDDLAQHHESVAKHAPGVWRLHMVGEPLLAGEIANAAHAHMRIDNWPDAESWIRQRLSGQPADQVA